MPLCELAAVVVVVVFVVSFVVLPLFWQAPRARIDTPDKTAMTDFII
jgi:hypothetical protein